MNFLLLVLGLGATGAQQPTHDSGDGNAAAAEAGSRSDDAVLRIGNSTQLFADSAGGNPDSAAVPHAKLSAVRLPLRRFGSCSRSRSRSGSGAAPSSEEALECDDT